MSAPTISRPARPSVMRGLAIFVVIAAAHYAGSVLAHAVNDATSQGVSLYPSAGVTVAALLLVRRSEWWIVLVSTFLAEYAANELLIREVFGTAFGSALSNAVEPLVGALVVFRLIDHPPDLHRPRDLRAFLAGAVVCGPVVGTLVGVTSTRFTPHHSPFFDVAGRWYVGDGLGVLVFGSLIMALAVSRPSSARTVRSGIEGISLVAALVVVTVFAFWGSAPALAYATLPVLVWASVRFGARGGMVCSAIVAVLADWATITDHGLFHDLNPNAPDAALWQLQLFLGVLVLTSLILASGVSELALASSALRRAEAAKRFQILLESSPDPVVIVRVDGSVEYANRQFQQLAGRSPDELIGTRFVELLSSSGRTAAEEAFAVATRAAEDTRTEFELTDLGGLGRTFETAVTPLTLHNDRVLVASLREVTERRRAEEATRRALAAAEQATRAKSEFLAMMSHEIRTPMNGVIGMVEILGRMSLESEQRHIVRTIAESAEALLSVINDILDFSKIEAGKLTVESSDFDIRDLVDGVTEVLSSSAAAKSVELSCIVADDVPRMVVGDPLRIRQVIYNLLGNAVKFTGEGSVQLEVTTDDGRLRLAITDTGIGMTEEQRQRLFEPFVQAEQSTTRRFGGSGLGLAIVLRLVELMGGAIDVTTVEGRGSTFTVTLAAPAAAEVAERNDLAGLRILALASAPVPRVTEMVIDALRAAGAQVQVAAEPRQAESMVADVDVLYISRSAESTIAHSFLDHLVRDLTRGHSLVAVADRLVDGTSWLPHATHVSTSALTARSVLRAIALASGRVVDPLADSEAFDSPRQVRADAPVVLVAEDHPTNRIVIRRQLGLLGVRCMIAGDGQEALEMLDRQDFALLLADCHMPRLDGYELTQRIREAEQRTGEHLPIVALTASALPSEAERCIASGMDLVLTKPVALDALERALSPWLSFEDSTPNGASEGAPPKEESVVDLSILRELLGDDDEAIDEVTSTFLESAAESVAQFDEAYAAGNTPGVRSAAHRLLGAARTLGATQLVQVCEEVEASNEAVPLEVADRLHHELSSVTGALAGLRSVRG